MSVKDAAKFAIKHHGDQKYGSKPYHYHLNKVFENARKYGGNENEQVAAWLHDVVEDTRVTKADVAKEFGHEVALIVDLVTNRPSKEKTFTRVRTHRSAVFVKLCDRLANVQAGKKNNMYKKRHESFRSILYRKGEFDQLWSKIDSILGYVEEE